MYITETHNNETNITREGIFAHVYNPDGTVQYTAYDWNHQMPRDKYSLIGVNGDVFLFG